jgi:uncharacterized protein (TIGR02147 family)
MISIFSYTDFRSFLRDAIAEAKKRNPHFSYRYIARHLELRSSAYFNLVLHGKRKLSEELAHKTANLLKLSNKEREYFLYLVQYADAKSKEERQFCFERMSSLRSRHVKKVAPGQYAVYAKWFYSVIRELVPLCPSLRDVKRIGKLLRPSIHSREVREAIAVLKKAGMVSETESGDLVQREALITTGDEWDSSIIHNYQCSLIEMGRNAMDTIPKEERDISSLMLPLSSRTFKLLCEELRKVRQKFLALSEEDREADKVYACALQLFPVTGAFKERDK